MGHLLGGHLGGAVGSIVGRSVGGREWAGGGSGVKTIDTGFQRLLVIITSVVLIGLSLVICWFLLPTFDWAGQRLDKAFPIAGALR